MATYLQHSLLTLPRDDRRFHSGQLDVTSRLSIAGRSPSPAVAALCPSSALGQASWLEGRAQGGKGHPASLGDPLCVWAALLLYTRPGHLMPTAVLWVLLTLLAFWGLLSCVSLPI